MRKFECVDNSYYNITPGIIYEAIEYISQSKFSDIILIKNDKGLEGRYVLHSPGGRLIFKEVTIVIRNEIIDEIIDEILD